MSNFNDLKSYALAAHGWFFRNGVAITSPGAGVVAIDNWPDADEPTLDDRFLGDAEECNVKKNVDMEEVFKATGGVLKRKDIITFFQSLDFDLTTNSLRRIAMEILYGSAVTLTEDVGEFTPLASEPPEGLLILAKYTNAGERIFEANLWGRMDVQELGSGLKKVVKPKFMFKMLDSNLNTMFFGKPELIA